MLQDWLYGFLSGVLATSLGFFLTLIWDIWKIRKDANEKHNAIMRLVREDSIINLQSSERNIRWLQQELKILSEDKSITQPLVSLKTGFWELAKVNLPNKFEQNNLLVQLRDIAFLADYINEFIRSREAYKLHGIAISNYKDRLQTIDELLLTNLEKMKEDLKTLMQVFE